MMPTKKTNYKSSGVDYKILDKIKILAQNEAIKTSNNLKNDFSESLGSRGESAYIFKKGDIYFASVIEGLGTKNLIADEMGSDKKTYYDIIGYDTVATIINDLATSGASPLVVNAYWAVGNSEWFLNKKRARDLIKGWREACDFSHSIWGGGETPTLKGIIKKDTCDLGGSAIGIVSTQPVTDKLSDEDRIILLKSNGINANGVTLVREIVKKFPNRYKTKINKKYLGDLLLRKTNIYSNLISDLLDNNVDIHYLVNITGHGLRKIMRSKKQFTYIIEKVFPTTELFTFLQKYSGLTNEEAYATWNMGQDYAIFLPKKDVERTLKIIKKHKFAGINAGYIKSGRKQIIITEKNIVYKSNSLKIR